MADDGPPVWLKPQEQEMWRRLLAVEARVRERLDSELRAASGVSLGGYEVLVHLCEAPAGALRMSDLASCLRISRSGLTRRVDGLAQRGLVARRACPVDGRGAMAELTPAGLRLLRGAAPTHVAGVRRYLVEPLGGLSCLGPGLSNIEAALEGLAPAGAGAGRSG